MVGCFVGSATGEAVGSGIGDAVGSGMGTADGPGDGAYVEREFFIWGQSCVSSAEFELGRFPEYVASSRASDPEIPTRRRGRICLNVCPAC